MNTMLWYTRVAAMAAEKAILGVFVEQISAIDDRSLNMCLILRNTLDGTVCAFAAWNNVRVVLFKQKKVCRNQHMQKHEIILLY